MAKRYVLSVDQSTQGTKALLFNEMGEMICRSDLPHRQIISDNGWVSHDPEEIYQNLLQSIRDVVEKSQIDANEIVCLGISNQRETSLVWDRETGKPTCHAIVWQCSRSRDICESLLKQGKGELIQKRTGLPLSPFFPASKLSWILENIPEARTKADMHRLCFGTIDTWLVYQLTDRASYKTDYSNASRTQLFHLERLCWDPDICQLFGIDYRDLPEVCASDSVFGYTNLGGLLQQSIPICGVLGDSHAALFGQGCVDRGMTKATYGTGSSVMMNIGETPLFSNNGLVTSLAWKYRGRVQYVVEGNLNYTGAVITWLQKDLGLVSSAKETQKLAEQANPTDTTYIVPAFTGLGAPYWCSTAKACISGMTRVTGRAELVKAGLECIAYQITDIVRAMEQDTGILVESFRVDGGPTNNEYLMQFQSDILNTTVQKPDAEELSGIGAAYMAGMSCGIFEETVRNKLQRKNYVAELPEECRAKKYEGWKAALGVVMNDQTA